MYFLIAFLFRSYICGFCRRGAFLNRRCPLNDLGSLVIDLAEEDEEEEDEEDDDDDDDDDRTTVATR